MKAEITLGLRTREVYKLFERKISGDRLFINAILHKINLVLNRCRKQDAQAINILHTIDQQLIEITRNFSAEIERFEGLLTKMKEFNGKQINFIVQFYPKITVSNSVSLKLVEFIEAYDRLIAVLKLLRLAGCFDSDEIFFSNIKRQQTIANQLLSKIVLT